MDGYWAKIEALGVVQYIVYIDLRFSMSLYRFSVSFRASCSTVASAAGSLESSCISPVGDESLRVV